MENSAIKALLQSFLDCKENTAAISDKALHSGSAEVINHVILEQGKCLEIIEKIQASDVSSIIKYQEGIRVSKNRITSEKRLLENVVAGKNLENLAGNSFGIGILAENEKTVWKNIESQAKSVGDISQQEVPESIVSGWVIFAGIAFLLILKKKGMLKNITQEGVRLYFGEQQEKLVIFLRKIFKVDKN